MPEPADITVIVEDSPRETSVLTSGTIVVTEDSPRDVNVSALAEHVFETTTGPNLTNPLNTLEDPSAEDPNRDPKAWFDGTNNELTPGWSYSTDSPRSGLYSLKADLNSNGLYLYNRSLMPVNPGVYYYIEAWPRATNAATSGRLAVGLEWLDADQVLISRSERITAAGAAPTLYTERLRLMAIAPPLAEYARFYLVTTGFTSGEFWYVDDCFSAETLPSQIVSADPLFNVSLGFRALDVNTTGSYNFAAGRNALRDNKTGMANTAGGYGAGQSNTSGDFNTLFGYFSLFGNTTGTGNSAFGANALGNNTTGVANTAGGFGALANSTTTTGNTAFGSSALYGITTGNYNIGIGYSAGYDSSPANKQSKVDTYAIFIGYQATRHSTIPNTTVLTNITAIGKNASVAANNSMVFGAVAGADQVNIGFGVVSPTAALHLRAGAAGAGQAPLKFTSGPLLTMPEAGAIGFLNDAFYGTITTGPTRKTFAFLEDPAFTGNPTVPTQPAGDNSTKIANTEFVSTALANLVASSPAALDTLNELATALGSDPNFATTMTSALAAKAPIASPVFITQITTPVTYGGSAANDDYTIEGTSHGTKPTSYVIIQPTGGSVGIGSTGSASSRLNVAMSNASTSITTGPYTLELTNTDQTNNNWSHFFFGDAVQGAAAAMMGCQFVDHTNNYGNFAIWTRGSKSFGIRLQIDSSGAVNIGNSVAQTSITAEQQGLLVSPGQLTITGGYATQRFTQFSAPTITAASALTVTNADTVNISALPVVGGSAVISGASALRIPLAPHASANVGLVSLGSGAWNGSTAGFFVGSASGTHLAINAASGYGGNFFDAQLAGVSKFSISSGGNVTIAGTTQIPILEVTATSGSGIHPTVRNPNNVAGFAQFLFYPLTGPDTSQMLRIVPFGAPSGTRAQLTVFNTDFIADAVNFEFCSLAAVGTLFEILSGKAGTGTGRPIRISANNAGSGSNQLYLHTDGNVSIGNATSNGKLNLTGDLTISGNIVLATSGASTMLASASNQKLGFWGKTPIIQPASAAQAALINSSGGVSNGTIAAVGNTSTGDQSAVINDNFTELFTLQDAMRTALVNSGLMKGAA